MLHCYSGQTETGCGCVIPHPYHAGRIREMSLLSCLFYPKELELTFHLGGAETF